MPDRAVEIETDDVTVHVTSHSDAPTKTHYRVGGRSSITVNDDEWVSITFRGPAKVTITKGERDAR